MKRFSYALNGLKTLLIKDQKFSLHIYASIIAIVFGFIFHINRLEWLFILLAISLVL
ncbi:diacylglycerol kinase family protein, partial [Bacillus sp. JR_15]